MGARGGDTDEGQCKTCGGNPRKVTRVATDDGDTIEVVVVCSACNGTGKA